MRYNKIRGQESPLSLGLHHFTGNIQVVKFALDDQFPQAGLKGCG